jgi:hypothetical protein
MTAPVSPLDPVSIAWMLAGGAEWLKGANIQWQKFVKPVCRMPGSHPLEIVFPAGVGLDAVELCRGD